MKILEGNRFKVSRQQELDNGVKHNIDNEGFRCARADREKTPSLFNIKLG